MASEAADLISGQVLAGRYRIGEEIGRGGMAIVYAAVDVDLGRPVAMKLLQHSMVDSDTVRRRVVREARAAAKLTSDHVVLVLDVGSLDDGQPWIVMERLEGCDLRQRLAAGALPIADAVDAILQACVALAEAHAIGLVHRDLKPSNLFLTSGPDGRTRLKVLDFGIAKANDADDGLTSANDLLGSPRYMSPEQLRASATVDARSDVWALGVVLYELLSQRSPFAGQTVAEVHAAILEHVPTPLGQHAARPNGAVPTALERAVLRCLAKDPDKRFASVVALAEAIAPFGSASASAYLQAARRYAQPASDRGHITSPAFRADIDSDNIESIANSSPAAGIGTAIPMAPRGEQVGVQVGQQTDATWNANVSPAARWARSWLVIALAAAAALSALLIVVQSRRVDGEASSGSTAASQDGAPRDGAAQDDEPRTAPLPDQSETREADAASTASSAAASSAAASSAAASSAAASSAAASASASAGQPGERPSSTPKKVKPVPQVRRAQPPPPSPYDDRE